MEDLYFNGEKLTPEIIEETKQWYVDLYNACIKEAVSGEVRVNNLQSYVEWQEKCISDIVEGRQRISLSFLQQAYYLQTGKSIALLP